MIDVSVRLARRAFVVRRVAKVFYILAGILILVIALYLVAAFMNAMKFREQVRAAEHISVGDSTAAVRQILGEPRMLIEKGSRGFFRSPYERETWAYYWWLKPEFELEWPFFYPVTLKFGPMETDIKIEFDASGRVYSIAVPKEP